MPHTKVTRAKAYQKMKSRRDAWIGANGPCRLCGSSVDLEVDHIDPSKKIHHAVWSWRATRMEEELRKCQVLCYECHKLKSAGESRIAMLGKPNLRCRALTPDQVRYIIEHRSNGFTERRIASDWKIGKTTVHSILMGETYQEITTERRKAC